MFCQIEVSENEPGPSQGLKIRGGGLVVLGGDNVPPWLRAPPPSPPACDSPVNVLCMLCPSFPLGLWFEKKFLV